MILTGFPKDQSTKIVLTNVPCFGGDSDSVIVANPVPCSVFGEAKCSTCALIHILMCTRKGKVANLHSPTMFVIVILVGGMGRHRAWSMAKCSTVTREAKNNFVWGDIGLCERVLDCGIGR